MKNLVSDIDKFIINTEDRMLAVVRQSISAVVKDAQIPIAKGGRMHVKTGFLRSSGIAELNAPPVGPTRGDPDGRYNWTADKLNAVLARMKLGDVFYFGWTAHYAQTREVFDAFLETAIQKWQTHVNNAVSHFRNKDASK